MRMNVIHRPRFGLPAVAAAALLVCTAALRLAAASTFSVMSSTSGYQTTFLVSRSDASIAETVRFRTVSLSAYAAQHFTVRSGTLVFPVGTNEQSVTVSEMNIASVAAAYRYQTGTSRSYRFEVIDEGGFPLVYQDRIFNYGTTYQFRDAKISPAITNLVYFRGSSSSVNYASGLSADKYIDVNYTPPQANVETQGALEGYVLIDDSNEYEEKHATISTSDLITSTGANSSYLDSIGCKIYATVCFSMKEKDDGYQYVQIVAGSGSAAYDGSDSDGTVKDPVNSLYKACFELVKGNKVDGTEGKQFFPHRYDDVSRETNDQTPSNTEFSRAESYLWKQKFRASNISSSYRAATSGSLVLAPSTSYITTRFDCGGKNDDTFGYRDLFVRMALCDTGKPYISAIPVLSPGPYCRGNTFYISVSFTEIVKPIPSNGRPLELATSWGRVVYESGNGSNVLTFKGTIGDTASGRLTITGFNGTVTDLVGNGLYNGSDIANVHFDAFVETNHVFTITYDLAGGNLPTANPTNYDYETRSFTLNNPVRPGYVFAGWKDGPGGTPQMNAVVNYHSHGNKIFTAAWTPIWGQDEGANGSAWSPYVISTREGLDMLAKRVNGTHGYIPSNLSGICFVLANDLAYDASTAWNDATGAENNFAAIGSAGSFAGTFDGRGHVISGIRISQTADDRQGLFGGNVGVIRNVTLGSSRIVGHADVGGIVGSNGGTCENCLVFDTAVGGVLDVGAIVGTNGVGGVLATNHYADCTVKGTAYANNVGTGAGDVPGARGVHGITLGTGVTASGESVIIAGSAYYAAGTTVTLGNATHCTVTKDGTNPVETIPVTETGGVLTFTMPAAHVTVAAFVGYCGDPGVNGGSNVLWRVGDGNGDGVNDTIWVFTNVLAVGAFDIADFSPGDAPWGDFSSSITNVVLDEGITRIGSNAFCSNTVLTSVVVPASVTGIGDGAFAGCTSLASLYLLPFLPPQMGADAFAAVPSACKVSYHGANYESGGGGWRSLITSFATHQRVWAVSCAENVTAGGNFVLVYGGVSYCIPGTTVTLDGQIDGYETAYAVSGSALPGNSFAMPGHDVDITATWTPRAPEYPAYLAQADESVKSNYVAWAARYGASTDAAYATRFLLDKDPAAVIPAGAALLKAVEFRPAGTGFHLELASDVSTLFQPAGRTGSASLCNGILLLDMATNLTFYASNPSGTGAGHSLAGLASTGRAVVAAPLTVTRGRAVVEFAGGAGLPKPLFVRAVLTVAAPGN